MMHLGIILHLWKMTLFNPYIFNEMGESYKNTQSGNNMMPI